MKYAPWQSDDRDDSYAWLDSGVKPQIAENEDLLHEGALCASWFPRDLVVPLDKDRGKKIPNAIPNTDHWLFVDGKVKAVFEANLPRGSVEFLPAKVRDHKKSIVDREFWIANVLTVVDCVDLKKSEYVLSEIDPTQVSRFARLVLDPKRIPGTAKLFRLASKKNLVIIREDLGKALRAEKITGMTFPSLDTFGARFRKKQGDDDEPEDEA